MPRNIAQDCRRLQTEDKQGVEQFLPGLPNEVVLDHVVPKLPWRAFHIMSSVSPCWREAIQSRQVYNARVRSKSTDTLVVLNHIHRGYELIQAISLYSTRDDSWHQLPKCPFSKRAHPENCQCVALDGKLYVLGGEEDEYNSDVDEDEYNSDVEGSDDGQEVDYEFQDGSKVYVLDLVGQTGWKKCADLPKPRRKFACGVLNGKVYVFGGFVCGRASSESLVYDPKEDKWISIAPMTRKRSCHHAVAVGDEFWVQGGEFGQERRRSEARYLEVYHPGKDEWEYVEQERCHGFERLFTVNGKPFFMTPCDIYRQEEPSKNKSWKRLQSISLSYFYNWSGADGLEVVSTQVVNGQLLAVVCDNDLKETSGGLYRTEWFDTEKEEIELVEVRGYSVSYREWDPTLMCSIEL